MYEIKQYHFSQISSTNDYARELLQTDKLVAVTAEYQWSGRGRGEKTWEGEQGKNIYCSIGIRHEKLLDMEALIALQAQGCLAAYRALKAIAPSRRFALKYPNDVLMLSLDRSWKKICGVLVEHEFAGSYCLTTVVGIGINIRQQTFPPFLHNKATSLLNEGLSTEVEPVITLLLDEWKALAERSPEQIIAEWKRELNIEGKMMEIVGDGPGWLSMDLLRDGRLRARHTGTGQERIIDNGDSLRYDLGE